LLEGHSDAQPGLPDQAATFSGAAVKQFKPWRKRKLAGQLQAGAARGDVDNPAIDNGRPRIDDDLGHTRDLA